MSTMRLLSKEQPLVFWGAIRSFYPHLAFELGKILSFYPFPAFEIAPILFQYPKWLI